MSNGPNAPCIWRETTPDKVSVTSVGVTGIDAADEVPVPIALWR